MFLDKLFYILRLLRDDALGKVDLTTGEREQIVMFRGIWIEDNHIERLSIPKMVQSGSRIAL